MSIRDDFSIDCNWNIRHIKGDTYYKVIELHRYLTELSEGWEHEFLDLTSPLPSIRYDNNLIELLNGFNIDDETAEYFYAGTIIQGDKTYKTDITLHLLKYGEDSEIYYC